MKEEPLGIPSAGFEYMKLKQGQNPLEEFLEIREFLRDAVMSDSIEEFQNKNKSIKFINYGDTQMVFVVSVGNDKYTLLLGQPVTKFGTVKKEHDNLKSLANINLGAVVAPFHYFQNGKRELYVTPYLYQARCIACDDIGWGVYVPEPDYHFKVFSDAERKVINSSMIAMLISLYDEKNNLGIASCKIGGGDFILEKGFEDEELTYENILKRMKLIAARERIRISLDEYIAKIKDEFSRRTYYRTEEQRDKSVLINYKCRLPMTEEEISRGITLGKKLRERKLKEQEK